ncbi:MAG: rhodanese-like domain-containing protein [Anaerolineae bacterium]|jgi:rhodanese-related sulfurtransferase
MKKLAILNVVLVFSLLIGSVALAADDILGDADNYFSGGTKNISADAIFENLNDGDDSNNPYIISVRSQEDYDKGHIPTAVRMDPKTLFTPENLATLPTDQQIVVYCYTGQTASQVSAALNMLGYDAYNLLFGFGAWNSDPNAGSVIFDETKQGNDFPTTTDPTIVTMIAHPPATPMADTTQAAANAYFGGGTKNIPAADLYDNLNDGDASNDPTVISVRSEGDYTDQGHIPGAIWLDVTAMFSPDGLVGVDPERPVVVYCYTGQTASQVTAALNILGYDASNMLFGMQAWTMDDDVRVRMFDAATHVFNYPYEGTAAGQAAEETTEETATEETTTEEAAEPEAMPETGGAAIPVEAVLVAFGALSAGTGLYLRRRKAA